MLPDRPSGRQQTRDWCAQFRRIGPVENIHLQSDRKVFDRVTPSVYDRSDMPLATMETRVAGLANREIL